MRKAIGWIFLIIVITIAVLGCGVATQAVSNYDACKNDPVCLQQMQLVGNMTQTSVSTAVKSTKLGSVADAIGIVVGGAVMFAFGIWKGKKRT